MDETAAIDLIFDAAQKQVDLNRQVLENHLDASDRIHARQASETLVRAAGAIAADPTN